MDNKEKKIEKYIQNLKARKACDINNEDFFQYNYDEIFGNNGGEVNLDEMHCALLCEAEDISKLREKISNLQIKLNEKENTFKDHSNALGEAQQFLLNKEK